MVGKITDKLDEIFCDLTRAVITFDHIYIYI